MITIESADSTQYKKNNETGEDEIILSGSVSVSVESGSSKVSINASLVTYNRVTDMLFAQGNVTLLQSSAASGGQSITAESLLFNTSTMEGVFDDGRVVQTQSNAINLPSGSTLVVASDMFGRDSSNTIAFDGGELTFCDEEDPHWKIKASKIWLLPGGEFAFFNAVLYVGKIPVFYLPAFYYPKDELIFNPSIGYNPRSGYHIQTTTYVIGRKPLNNSSSSSDDVTAALYNFMRPSSLKKQVREGLVLHNTDEDFSGSTSEYLKVLADCYSNLGYMVGVEAVFNPSKFISSINSSVRLGFSNTVFETGGLYLPYSASGKTYSDSSNFMGLSLPFRYSAALSMTLKSPFNLTLSMPIYSDPYFASDFGNRSEYMDWIGFLMDDGKEESTGSSVSSFAWTASTSHTFAIPDIVKPFINSASVSSVSASIDFSSKARSDSDFLLNYDGWKNYSPERMFFYPSQITPLKATGRISGTLVSVSSTSKPSSKKSPSFPVQLVSPWDAEISGTDADNSGNEETNSTSDDKSRILEEIQLPSLVSSSSHEYKSIPGTEYSLSYSIDPAFTSQLTYSSAYLTKPEDFDWSKIQSSYVQLKMPATVTSNFSYRGSFVNLKNNFSLNYVYQSHPKLNGYYDGSGTLNASGQSILTNDYNARRFELTQTNSLSFRPFIYDSIFKNSGVDWNTTLKVFRTKFTGDWKNPEWNFIPLDITDKESVTSHTLSAFVSASEEGGYSQKLNLSTTLPPQNEEYNASLSLTFPYGSFGLSGGVKRTRESTDWNISPLQQSASLNLLKGTLRFSQAFNFSIKDSSAESLRFSLDWKNLQISFSMQNTYGYHMEYSGTTPVGWVANSDKQFLPVSASLSYVSPSKTFLFWKNRIALSPSVNTSIYLDALRPTNSYFKFIPSVTFKINEFMNLTFSSESRNNVIYRYVQDFIDSDIKIDGETNPIVDLLNSFAFWGNGKFYDSNQTLRKSSGFKLKNLKVTLTHDLHDFDLNSSFIIQPRLTTGQSGLKEFDFTPYFSFSVSWRPMSSLKASIVDSYGEWKLNP